MADNPTSCEAGLDCILCATARSTGALVGYRGDGLWCGSQIADTPTPEAKVEIGPSLEERYEVSVEEAIVYGTGRTKGGGTDGTPVGPSHSRHWNRRATAAEITYEFHPLESVGHEWLGADTTEATDRRLRMESLTSN